MSNELHSELFDLEAAILRFDGTCALLSLLREQYYLDSKPEQSKLMRGYFVTEQALYAIENLLSEQKQMFDEIAVNLYEIYFSNKEVFEKVGAVA